MTTAEALARVNARPVNNTRAGAYQLVSERLALALKAAKEKR